MNEFDDLYNRIVVKQSREYDDAEKKVQLQEEIKDLNLTDIEYTQFLQDIDSYKPTLYDVNMVLDDTIVGEYKTRMSVSHHLFWRRIQLMFQVRVLQENLPFWMLV